MISDVQHKSEIDESRDFPRTEAALFLFYKRNTETRLNHTTSSNSPSIRVGETWRQPDRDRAASSLCTLIVRVLLPGNVAAADLRLVQSGLGLAVGAVGRPVVFGEGLELQRVKGVLSAADVLHSVFSAAALTGETERDGGVRQNGDSAGNHF